MNVLDLVFIVIAAVTTISGMRRGLARQVFDLAGLFISLFAALAYSRDIAEIIAGKVNVPAALSGPVFFQLSILDIVTFFIIFIILRMFFGYLGSLTGIIAYVPVVSTADHLAGALLGFLKAVVLVTIFVLVFGVLPFAGIQNLLVKSAIYHMLAPLWGFILGLF